MSTNLATPSSGAYFARVAKPKFIELENAGIRIPIVYEDRSVLALDKPAGWMLAPDSWDRTGRNLQLALQSSLNAGDFWARSRNLKFLRFIHRLDAETTGINPFARSPGYFAGLQRASSRNAGSRSIAPAVVHGVLKPPRWTCAHSLIPDPGMKGRMRTVLPGGPADAPKRGSRRTAENTDMDSQSDLDQPEGGYDPAAPKDAETHFQVLQALANTALAEARPTTGRTHQIRAHLGASGHPVVGDPLYGNDLPAASKGRQRLALRAVKLAFQDPFQKRMIYIQAPADEFIREYGFDPGVFSQRKRVQASNAEISLPSPLGERKNPLPQGGKPGVQGMFQRCKSIPLSPRERDRVRGKGT